MKVVRLRMALVLSIIIALLAMVGCSSSNTAPNTSPGSSPANSPNGGTGGTGGGTQTNQATPTPTPAPAMTTVRFSEVIRSIFYAPLYIAIEKGFLKDEGINVDLVTSQGSDKGAAALLAGTADISLIGPETTIFIANQAGSKKVKVFYQLTMKDGSFLLSRSKNDSFKWSDLNGKNIVGWRPGSAPNMVLNAVLKKEKVTNANVITNLAAPAMVGAFESGKGDYIQLYEPLASMLETQGKAYFVASMGEQFGNYPETSFVATSDYIKANPQIIQNWTNALIKATKWLQDSSLDDSAKALAPYFTGTDLNLIKKSIERYNKQGTWSLNPIMDQAQFDILQNVLVENGVLKADQKVKMDDVLDMSFVQKAAK
ncbi:ABC transporter substrate-binding protein [Ferviditalea candida]|uniref:ABC transporter substrate-binding protein n=1 Tax=Ferviditalea candida TaxID=3108399 RepID=A0ABU5ZIP1_9BACL|nr:ABC transporter substrate-binding protein [Paenibacillaceae bacterium T2]